MTIGIVVPAQSRIFIEDGWGKMLSVPKGATCFAGIEHGAPSGALSLHFTRFSYNQGAPAGAKHHFDTIVLNS